jgi:general secretion pathway protein G
MIRALSFSIPLIVTGFVSVFIYNEFWGPRSGGSKHMLVQSDFQSISRALETYRKMTGDYPTTDQGLMALGTRPESLSKEMVCQAIIFTQIPTDPWKNEYRYRRLPDSSPYPFDLRCIGPDGIEGNKDDRVPE